MDDKPDCFREFDRMRADMLFRAARAKQSVRHDHTDDRAEIHKIQVDLLSIRADLTIIREQLSDILRALSR